MRRFHQSDRVRAIRTVGWTRAGVVGFGRDGRLHGGRARAGYPGSAIPKALIGRQRWAFDAVYTPVDTRFLNDCRDVGLEVISGYELFFHQGVDAFRLFTGQEVDPAALRKELAQSEQTPEVCR